MSRRAAGSRQTLILGAFVTISFVTFLCSSVCLSFVCLSFCLSVRMKKRSYHRTVLFTGVFPLCCSINKMIVQSKHNNIFSKMKSATCSGYK